ncbi:hypothetical protein BDR06DRAFT_969444 [Suillus hirtellus]|nr:hypothetical protein BDR06DRAFT_969444 [Suillus hirtellus]
MRHELGAEIGNRSQDKIDGPQADNPEKPCNTQNTHTRRMTTQLVLEYDYPLLHHNITMADLMGDWLVAPGTNPGDSMDIDLTALARGQANNAGADSNANETATLLNRMQQLYLEYSQKFPQNAPSSQGKPSEFKGIQKDLDLTITGIDPLWLHTLYPAHFFIQSSQHNINLRAMTIDGSNYTTNSDVQYEGFHYAIAKVKNEIGFTKAEPHIIAQLGMH